MQRKAKTSQLAATKLMSEIQIISEVTVEDAVEYSRSNVERIDDSCCHLRKMADHLLKGEWVVVDDFEQSSTPAALTRAMIVQSPPVVQAGIILELVNKTEQILNDSCHDIYQEIKRANAERLALPRKKMAAFFRKARHADYENNDRENQQLKKI